MRSMGFGWHTTLPLALSTLLQAQCFYLPLFLPIGEKVVKFTELGLIQAAGSSFNK